MERLGFKGGRILEPALGSGLWLGGVPQKASNSCQWTGVELDPTSGRIAQLLYPEAKINVRGFEEVLLPDNYFDLALGNVPFSAIAPNDPLFPKCIKTLHDYFFVKALRLVRPGGLLVFITSVGTLQSKKSRAVRELLSESADLVGAMRFPNTAFQQFTNTQVTTDLVILQKRQHPELEPKSLDWLEVVESGLASDEGKPLSLPLYYQQHPEMLLGKLCVDKLYGGSNRLGLASDGRDLRQAITEAFSYLPEGIYKDVTPSQQRQLFKTKSMLIPPELQGQLKPFNYVWYDNSPWQAKNGRLESVVADGIPRMRLYWLIQVRVAVKEVFLVQVEGGNDEELASAQRHLNSTYDYFVSRYDWLHSPGNRRVFAEDPEYPLLLALENFDPNRPEKTTKTDIFTKRTIQEYRPKTSATSAKEALIYSLSERGRIDIEFMAQLRNQEPDVVIEELQQDKLIYLDPASKQWLTADEYLSGNVRVKLSAAIDAAQNDSQYALNVQSLEAVQPKELLPGDIYIRLGTSWIPESDIEEFIAQTLNVPKTQIHVHHFKGTATWSVDLGLDALKSPNNTKVYGTSRVAAHQLIEMALNLRVPVVKDKLPDEQYVKNKEATRQAQAKLEDLKEAFKRWLWSDLSRAERLAKVYNEQYNCLVPRSFDGSHLELPGMSPHWREKMRSHQLNAIWRIITTGNALLCHPVGAGKTAEVVAASLELKRLGLCNKPCITVMDHLPEQVASEALQMYPQMRLLIAGSAQMEGHKRQELAARIATGNWDLIILSHTAFSKLRLKPETVQRFLEEESELIQEDYLEAKNDGHLTKRVLKHLENKLSSLKERIKEVATNPHKDNTVFFDELGIDWIFYDESQQVKRKDPNTKLIRILGVPQGGSYRAEDFYHKTRYMSYIHGSGKGIGLITATPITNTMAEAWVNQLYLQYETLKQMGMLHFDAWVSNFAEIKVAVEITAQGTLEVKNRLALFNNLPEWRQVFSQVADIVTDDELKLPKPSHEYVTVEVPATPEQLKFFSSVARRAEAIKAGKVEPTEDNMPLITTHVRQGVVDLRLLSKSVLREFLSADEIQGLKHSYTKIKACIDNVLGIWQSTQAERLTQLVFCDVGTPNQKSDGRFCAYEEIKSQLISRGIPSEEIAFIHDAKTDEQKAALFRAVRFGKIRVFIGSTSKMGVGTNVQNYVVAAHDLDCPLRPSDHTQRRGRSVRQGNINSKVTIYRYVTQGKPYQSDDGQEMRGLSPDGYLYQTSVTKGQFIEDAIAGRNATRSIEDCTDIVLSYAEAMASATGDPRLMRKVELDTQVAKLTQEERDYINQQVSTRRELERLPGLIQLVSTQVAHYQADLARRVSTSGSKFLMTLLTTEGRMLEFDKRTEAGETINAIAKQLEASAKYGNFPLGQFAGFNLFIEYSKKSLFFQENNVISPKCTLHLVGEETYIALSQETPLGTISSLERCVSHKIDEALQKSQKLLVGYQKDFQYLSAQIERLFPKASELQVAKLEQLAINKELGLSADDPQVITWENDENTAA